MYYIYRITNLINGKTYIGQRKHKSLNDSYMGSGKLLRQAFKKYGIENFKKDILVFNVSKKEHIDLLEKVFIAAEREKVGIENCYNIADGGQNGNAHKGHLHSEESKKKMSEAHKNMSDETRKKISKAHKGKPAWNKGKSYKGKPCSEEKKKKISETLKGHRHSEETKRKMSEKYKGKHWKLVDGKRVYY